MGYRNRPGIYMLVNNKDTPNSEIFKVDNIQVTLAPRTTVTVVCRDTLQSGTLIEGDTQFDIYFVRLSDIGETQANATQYKV